MRIGVDEAGKGPVLGSMFAAAVRADPAALPDGVADSKTLSPERRETLAGAIADIGTVGVAEIPVDRIDDPMTDMTSLTVEAHAEALSALPAADAPIYVDAGETDANRFGRRVARHFDTEESLTARHGADATNPIVAAASIIAKVRRDAHVETLADRHGAIGSGYPSDPATRSFLADYVAQNDELPPCARSSWATAEDVITAAEQAGLEQFRKV